MIVNMMIIPIIVMHEDTAIMVYVMAIRDVYHQQYHLHTNINNNNIVNNEHININNNNTTNINNTNNNIINDNITCNYNNTNISETQKILF